MSDLKEMAMNEKVSRIETQIDILTSASKDISLSLKALIRIEVNQNAHFETIRDHEVRIRTIESQTNDVPRIRKLVYGAVIMPMLLIGGLVTATLTNEVKHISTATHKHVPAPEVKIDTIGGN